VVDECDKVLGNPKMRTDIQDIFVKTPHHKQVMMFSATMPEDMKKGIRKLTKTARNFFKTNQISSSMKVSSSSTDWLNSMFISMRYSFNDCRIKNLKN